jgi:hypothetical protein
MFFDKQLGKLRPIRGTDAIDPCKNYRCAIDQMVSKNDKYNRWLLSRKWPGSVSASDTNVMKDITEDDYLELAEQIEKFCEREVSQIDNLIRSIPRPSIWNRIGKFFGGDGAGNDFYIIILLILIIFFLIFYVVKPEVVKSYLTGVKNSN